MQDTTQALHEDSSSRRKGDALTPEQWPTSGRRLERQGPSLRDAPRPETLNFKGNAFTRWFGWTVIRLHGWDIRGAWPKDKKVIAVAGAHTCNYDAWLAIFVQMALNTRFSFFIKKEAFAWPFGYLWRWMGGVPVDRSNPVGLIEAVKDHFEKNEKAVFAVTPEGTRHPPKRLKSGVLRLANELNIPLLPVTWDFDTKTIWIQPPFEPMEDFEEFEQTLYRYWDGIRGGTGYFMGVDSPNGQRLPDPETEKWRD